MSIGNKLVITILLIWPGFAWAHSPNGLSGVNVNGINDARKPILTSSSTAIFPASGHQNPKTR